MQLIVLLVVVALVVDFAWLLAAVVVTVVVARLVGWWLARRDDRAVAARRRVAEIRARADRQHAWVLASDDRGIYGEYPSKQIAVDAGSIAYQRLCTSEAVFGPWDL
jgi:hypothetical protein